MNAAQVLQEDGVAVVLAEAGKLKIIGLDAIPPERALKVLDFAKENKARLLAELAEAGREWVCLEYWRGCSKCRHYNGSSFRNWCGRGYRPQLPPEKEYDSHHRRITPTMVRNYRAACPWLLDRLDALRGAGWTVKRLFGMSRLRWPYLWGVAWSSAWTSPGWTPSLTAEGVIQWEIRESRRAVYQASKPGQ